MSGPNPNAIALSHDEDTEIGSSTHKVDQEKKDENVVDLSMEAEEENKSSPKSSMLFVSLQPYFLSSPLLPFILIVKSKLIKDLIELVYSSRLPISCLELLWPSNLECIGKKVC